MSEKPLAAGGEALTAARARGQQGVRLAELVAALSLATDLGLGQPMEHVLRSCRIALRLADELDVDDEERAVTYYTALLAWVCCHADAYEQAQWFGDDIALRAETYDAGSPRIASVRPCGSRCALRMRLRHEPAAGRADLPDVGPRRQRGRRCTRRRVEAEDTITDTTRHVLTAYLTMVALDDRGRPTEVRQLEVDGPEASRRCRVAQLRRDIRLAAPPDLHQLHAALHAGRTDRSLVP
jgi:hypothetical protein